MFLLSILNLSSLSLRPFILFLSQQARKKRPAPTHLTTSSGHRVELFSTNTYSPSCLLWSLADFLRGSLCTKIYRVCRPWTETRPAPPKPWCDLSAPRLSQSWTPSALQDEHFAEKSTVPSACLLVCCFPAKWRLYEGCGKCRYKYRFMDNLQSIAQCISSFPFQGQLQYWPCTSLWQKNKSSSVRLPWLFSSYKIVIPSPFLSLFFKQTTSRFSNFLVFVDIWSQLCNIRLHYSGCFKTPNNYFLGSWATELTICGGCYLSDL